MRSRSWAPASDEPDCRSIGRSLAAIIAVVTALLGSCSSGPITSSTVGAPTNGQISPLLDSTLSTPHWFTGTDGSAHLVYELQLTNAVPTSVTLNTVEVHDADTGATLARLTHDSLLAATSLATAPDTPRIELPPASVSIVWMDIPLAGADAVPRAITHRITIDSPPGVPLPAANLAFTGAADEVDRRPPVVLGPPLSGPGWAALGSCCDGPHRRALYPIDGRWYLAQRFAIDFNKLDAENRPGTGDPTLPGSFPTFGQPVYAVAGGKVVVAVDGMPDLNIGEHRDDPTPDDAGGNRVVLDIGAGHFVVYAHLQQHSVTVHSGDRVERGSQIAKVGSSGTSGGPHLHLQVTDRPSVVLADGMPYVFDSFELTGQTPPLAEVLRHYDTLDPIPITTARTGPRRDELPLGGDVVAFAGAEGQKQGG